MIQKPDDTKTKATDDTKTKTTDDDTKDDDKTKATDDTKPKTEVQTKIDDVVKLPREIEEQYFGEWPVFMQTKMNNTPPPKEKKPLNDGILINPFNQFRRRLPALMGGSSRATGWDASPAPPRGPQLDGDKDEKQEEVDPETKLRFKKLAYEPKESSGGSGGGGGIIIIAGIIVALFIFA